MARKFFFICGGILMLALAYHFGATTARAQQNASIFGVSSSDGGMVVVTPNGDTFYRQYQGGTVSSGFTPVFVNVGNFWTGSPTPVQSTSFGALKAKYR